ncbi:hypothetical protein ACH3XW_30045 [Acanthocheilonema viteae]
MEGAEETEVPGKEGEGTAWTVGAAKETEGTEGTEETEIPGKEVEEIEGAEAIKKEGVEKAEAEKEGSMSSSVGTVQADRIMSISQLRSGSAYSTLSALKHSAGIYGGDGQIALSTSGNGKVLEHGRTERPESGTMKTVEALTPVRLLPTDEHLIHITLPSSRAFLEMVKPPHEGDREMLEEISAMMKKGLRLLPKQDNLNQNASLLPLETTVSAENYADHTKIAFAPSNYKERDEKRNESGISPTDFIEIILTRTTQSVKDVLSKGTSTENVGAGQLTSTIDIERPGSTGRLHRKPMTKETEIRKEGRYGTTGTLSASEIVQKMVKFEEKRLNIANKTDSNDIYIRADLLASKPTAIYLPARSSELEMTDSASMASSRNTSIVGKRLKEMLKKMNETQEKSMNMSKSATGNETMFSHSKINFTETDSYKSLDDMKLEKTKIEMTKSKSTIEESTKIDEKESDSKVGSSLNETSKIGSKSTFNVQETSSDSEFVEEVEEGWREALEVLREQLRVFEGNIKLIVHRINKTASKKREESQKNRKTSIMNLLSSKHEFGNNKELKKLSASGLYVNGSRKNYKLKNETISKNAESMMKFDKKIVEGSWQKSTFKTAMNSSEMRRKTLQTRNHQRLMKTANETYAEEEKMKLNEENAEEKLMHTRLLEEKARLEEARLLREEQMQLMKQQEFHHGFADKAQLERQEQIIRRLEQLAEMEREYREQLEREGRIRMKLYMTTPPNESSSPNPIDSDKENLMPLPQCSVIRKFVKVYAVDDPVKWIRDNCSIVKIYFPDESCGDVENLFNSCFQ